MHEGIDTVVSRYSVDETVARLQSLLSEKGIKLFCLIDHSGEAAAAGLSMPPTKLLIFGNPKAGTPIMVAAPAPRSISPSKSWSRKQRKAKSWSSGPTPPGSNSATDSLKN